MKGQTAFESLVVMLIVLSSAIFILGLYTQTNDATMAVSIARDELFSQANGKAQQILIENVSFEMQNGVPTIKAKTNPGTLTMNDFDLATIKQKISEATKLDNIEIKINS